jgi:hypothetical protein
MERWTDIDDSFNLSPNIPELSNGCWVHWEPDHCGFRDKALILPAIRFSYHRVEDFEIREVEEGRSEIRVHVVADNRLKVITFRYVGLYRKITHL